MAPLSFDLNSPPGAPCPWLGSHLITACVVCRNLAHERCWPYETCAALHCVFQDSSAAGITWSILAFAALCATHFLVGPKRSPAANLRYNEWADR